MAKYYEGIIRDKDSQPEQVRKALIGLGGEFGRVLAGLLCFEPAIVITPLNEECSTLKLRDELTVVVTTKADLELFGRILAGSLEPSLVGFMDFEGRRGLEALEAPVREIELPPTQGRRVVNLVIAKSVLATGCTAISLTRTAMNAYQPERLLVASLFYSVTGVNELAAEFPEAEYLVLGEADHLDDNGMLHPGVGLIENRV